MYRYMGIIFRSLPEHIINTLNLFLQAVLIYAAAGAVGFSVKPLHICIYGEWLSVLGVLSLRTPNTVTKQTDPDHGLQLGASDNVTTVIDNYSGHMIHKPTSWHSVHFKGPGGDDSKELSIVCSAWVGTNIVINPTLILLNNTDINFPLACWTHMADKVNFVLYQTICICFCNHCSYFVLFRSCNKYRMTS